MTTNGGSKDDGIIFSFDPSTSIYTNLENFDGVNGANPYGSLLQGSNGILYGMTSAGGSCDAGVIFSFNPSSSSYTKLKDFDNIGGANPYGSLIQATDGKLYGMTLHGGNTNVGVIFSFNLITSAYTKLKDFDYIYNAQTEITNGKGAYPYGNLVQAGDGKLYGMTCQGGDNSIEKGDGGSGIIFSFDVSSSIYTKLKDLDGATGNNPYGSFIQASNGILYGMTSQGGTDLQGVIFSYDPPSSTYTKLNDFSNDGDGASAPGGTLLQTGDGKMYAMTHSGRSSGLGAVFSYDASSFVYTKLIDYTGSNGSGPYFGSAFIEETANAPVPVTLLSLTGKNNGNTNQLSWKVEFEDNLDYYALQRSVDGQDFKEISQINAAGYNSYRYNDFINTALSSIYYYRLKSVDKDGKSKYGIVIKIRTHHNEFAVVNPNPFKNKLVVNIQSVIGDKATLIVTDINGRKLCKENKQLSAGTNVVEMNQAARLSKGTYILTIIESQQTQSIKIVKGN